MTDDKDVAVGKEISQLDEGDSTSKISRHGCCTRERRSKDKGKEEEETDGKEGVEESGREEKGKTVSLKIT